MKYDLEFKPQFLKDIHKIPEKTQQRILAEINHMQSDLAGDVKKLNSFQPAYRLRIGDYRILFDVVGNRVIVFRIRHRREAYQ